MSIILVREVSEQIMTIQSQIIEMEVEKTHMQGKNFFHFFFLFSHYLKVKHM